MYYLLRTCHYDVKQRSIN